MPSSENPWEPWEPGPVGGPAPHRQVPPAHPWSPDTTLPCPGSIRKLARVCLLRRVPRRSAGHLRPRRLRPPTQPPMLHERPACRREHRHRRVSARIRPQRQPGARRGVPDRNRQGRKVPSGRHGGKREPTPSPEPLGNDRSQPPREGHGTPDTRPNQVG